MFAVIVHAQPGAQARDVIPRLAPLLDLREDTVRRMCARGFVTIESSLSQEEGMFVLARLQAEGLPAELVEESSLLTESPASPPAPTSVTLFEEEDWDDMMGTLDFLDQDPATQAPSIEEIVIPPPAKSESSAQGGWGALFPDLHAAPAGKPSRPSTPPESLPPASTAPPASALSFGAEPIAPDAAPVRAELAPQPVAPRADTPTPPQIPSSPRRPGTFQGGELLQALGVDRGEQPPYTPEGYDPRPPHSPVIARWLSVLAPGAGQVYNGEDRLSLDYGLRFFLIAPWFKSVKQAERRAEKIATYWAPRPPKDHMVRTLKYMAAWYLSVASFIGVCSLVGILVYDQLTHVHVEPISPVTVAQCVNDARLEVQQARIAGLDAMNDMMEELQASRSQMSDEERIKRLFIRGLEDCQRGHFPSCEETMRRVSELAEGKHRDAFRLQAWAAMRRRGGQPVPMPEIDASIRTLAEYEQIQHDARKQDDEASRRQDLESDDTSPEPPLDDVSD